MSIIRDLAALYEYGKTGDNRPLSAGQHPSNPALERHRRDRSFSLNLVTLLTIAKELFIAPPPEVSTAESTTSTPIAYQTPETETEESSDLTEKQGDFGSSLALDLEEIARSATLTEQEKSAIIQKLDREQTAGQTIETIVIPIPSRNQEPEKQPVLGFFTGLPGIADSPARNVQWTEIAAATPSAPTRVMAGAPAPGRSR